MNARTLESKRGRRWGWMLLLSAAVALGSSSAARAQKSDFPIDDDEHHRLLGYHGVVIDGVGQFNVATAESIQAVPGEWGRDRSGFGTLPLKIVGMAGRGYAEGIGETVYWLDKTRPVEGSGMRSKVRGANFPAVKEMHFHLMLTTESLPGRTFRSINPAIMVNSNARVFPPRLGTHYSLQQEIEFEDVNEPGIVVLRIVSNKNEIVGIGRDRWSSDRRPAQD